MLVCDTCLTVRTVVSGFCSLFPGCLPLSSSSLSRTISSVFSFKPPSSSFYEMVLVAGRCLGGLAMAQSYSELLFVTVLVEGRYLEGGVKGDSLTSSCPAFFVVVLTLHENRSLHDV